jgi:hypothetical protein
MAVLKSCEGPGCHVVMAVKPALLRRKRYCSKGCARRAWKGQRRSPATEFQPGNMPQTWVPVGTERVRKGYVQIKVAEPNVWRPRGYLAWERAHGRPVPLGFVIRRQDGDMANDDPSNLDAISRAENLRRQRLAPAVERRRLSRLRAASHRRWERYREQREEQRVSRFDSFGDLISRGG